jgi:hypothetical protein
MWDFDERDDTLDWEGMPLRTDTDVDVFGGAMLVRAMGPHPASDSPAFSIQTTDRTVMVIQVAVEGPSTIAAEVVWRFARDGANPPLASPPRELTNVDWDGPGDSVWDLRRSAFEMFGDGAMRTYYVPLVVAAAPSVTPQGLLSQVRVRWSTDGVQRGWVFQVSSLRIAERPCITHVLGCGRVLRVEAWNREGGATLYDPQLNPPPSWRQWVRAEGSRTDQYFADFASAVQLRDRGTDNTSLPWGVTYNCLRSGGDTVVVKGTNLGVVGSRVSVGGAPCTHVRHNPASPNTELACRVPSLRPGPAERVLVAVADGALPGLVDAKPFLSYAAGPRAPVSIGVSNVGSRHASVSWQPRSLWDALSTTGYVIETRRLLQPRELWASVYPSLIRIGAGSLGAAGNDSVFDGGITDTDVVLAASQPKGWLSLLPQSVSDVLLNHQIQSSEMQPAPQQVGAWGAAVTVAQLQAAADASGVPPALLAAIAVDQWGQVGWRVEPTLAGEEGSLLSSLGGWPALEALPSAWGPWRRIATTGNVTTTTVAGLLPDAPFQVRVAAVAEDTHLDTRAWQDVDLHGHRPILPQGSMGPWSNTSMGRTLEADLLFDWFDANSTLSFGPDDRRSTRGELGREGGEGRWGLMLVGSAHIAGCNATHSCCDGFAAPSFTEPVDGNAVSFDQTDANGDGVVDRTSSWSRDWWRQAFLPEEDSGYGRGEGSGDEPKVYPPFSGSRNPHELTRGKRMVAQAGGVVPPTPGPLPGGNFSAPVWSACSLACTTPARLRPPYLNARSLRSAGAYPLPTPLPAGGVFPGAYGGPPSVQAGASHSAGTSLESPGLLPSGVTIVPPRFMATPPTGPCGPALRLTGAHPGQTGAAWYGRRMQVREGFSTEFVFQLSNPSAHCSRMNDAYTNCRSRGADGLAFVIQDAHPSALGRAGGGQGWGGLPRTVAVSFDSWYNPEHSDPYENHVAVHAPAPPDSSVSPQGDGNLADDRAASEAHAYALGVATEGIPDLAERPMHVRVVYDPLPSGSSDTVAGFQGGTAQDASQGGPQQLSWIAGNQFAEGKQGWWSGSEVGSLRVEMPPGREILRVRVDLHAVLGSPVDGRAWVGFTAATGNLAFQSHEVLAWKLDQAYALAQGASPGRLGRFPAVVTNEDGEHKP